MLLHSKTKKKQNPDGEDHDPVRKITADGMKELLS